VTYSYLGATVQVSFGDYTTEDSVFAAIDLVTFVSSFYAELYWGLRALNTSVFQASARSRPDANLVSEKGYR